MNNKERQGFSPVNTMCSSTFNLCFFVSEMYNKFYKLDNLIKLEIAYVV